MARRGVRLFVRSSLWSGAGDGPVVFPTYVVALMSPMPGTALANAPNSFFWCVISQCSQLV